MGIADFIPSYPNLNENVSFELSKLREFHELRLDPVSVRKPGLFPNQISVQRFFAGETPYESALLAKAPGTGKTCAATAVIEHWKRIRNGEVPRGKALVLAKGDLLIDNFANEVYRQCASSEYSAILTKEEVEMSPSELKSKIRKELSKYYEFQTIGRFLVSKSGMNPSKARANYSNRVIIIDEAHKIQPQSQKKEKAEIYAKLHEFLHSVVGCRILLMTGTPIWDQASQFADLMNLILPLDAQLLKGSQFFKYYLDSEGNLTKRGEEEIGRAVRGRVFYLRTENSNVKKTTIGVTAPYTKHLRIFPTVMSLEQSEAVKTAESLIKNVKGKQIQGGVAHNDARSAATCIIPVLYRGEYDYQYGNEAFDRICGNKVEKTVRMKNGKLKKTIRIVYSLPPYLRDEYSKRLELYSSKYAAIIREIKEHPNQVVFIFTELAQGSGAVLLGLILELHGLKRVTNASGVSTISNERRFTVLSSVEGSVSGTQETSAILEWHNRPDNWKGDRLQVIIGSEKISVGLTIKHVRQFHCVVPPWNIPTLIQSTARAVRYGSHEAIPPEEREIRLFNHASLYSDSSPSIDVWAYQEAERKDYQAAGIYRLIKENSIDCSLSYRRNVLEGDEDFSPETNYREKNYDCHGFPSQYIDKNSTVWKYEIPSSEIDSRNWNSLYSENLKTKFTEDIKNLFRTTRTIIYDDMITLLGISPSDEIVFLKALSDIVEYQYPIQDRFGFTNYLEETDNIYSIKTKEIFEEKKNIIQIVEANEIEKDLKILSPSLLSGKIEGLSHLTRILVIEDLFRRSLSETLEPHLKKIVEENRNKFFRIKGGWVYNFHSEKPSSAGYAIHINKILAEDLHFLPDGSDSWIEIEDPEIVRQVSLVRAHTLVPDPEKLSGKIDERGFTISDGKVQGRICNTWSVNKLLRMFEKLDYLPPAVSKYQRSTKEDLLRKYENYGPKNKNFMKKMENTPEDEPPFRDVYSMSRDELCQVISVLDATKAQLCDWLASYFRENGMLG